MLSAQFRTDGAEVDPAGIADVVAAGTVPWRRADDGTVEVALVHRPRYDDWSWPKGHQDPGEALTSTALRETVEEAHLECRLGARLGHTAYDVPGKGHKVVHYWAAEVVRDPGFTATDETDELRWLPRDEADTLLSRPADADLLDRLDQVGPPSSTVVLVRHAKAGNRAAWRATTTCAPSPAPGSPRPTGSRTSSPASARTGSRPPRRCAAARRSSPTHGRPVRASRTWSRCWASTATGSRPPTAWPASAPSRRSPA